MKTSDFYTKPSSKSINESMAAKFGEKLDLENYTNVQLDSALNLIESKIASYSNSQFNATLDNEEYHRLIFMRDTVKTAISERAVSKAQQKAAGAALAAKRGKGKAKGASKEMMKMSTKELEKFAGTKHKGLPEKKKKVKESMQTMYELARDLAEKYADAHRKGDFKKMKFYKEAIEECGATISHGPMGECMMSHPHQHGGKPMPLAIIMPAGGAGSGAPVMTSEASKKPKPDYLDFDKDGNKKEPMKKALADKKKKGPANFVKESKQRTLREGEEAKAELVMAVKNMVDKFTGWSEDIAKMQTQSAMEMADDIRDEIGSDSAETFSQTITPALDAAFQAVKAAREALNSQVAALTGTAPAEMGAEPMGSEVPDLGAEEPTADLGAEEPAADMGGDDLAAAGETPPGGREKRESIERTRRLARILVGR